MELLIGLPFTALIIAAVYGAGRYIEWVMEEESPNVILTLYLGFIGLAAVAVGVVVSAAIGMMVGRGLLGLNL
jgi:hypothetical protein